MSSAQQNPNRLAHLPIAFFSMVMGLTGLTIAWEKAQSIVKLDLGITLPLIGLSSLVFAVLFVLYLSKLVLHREAVMNELRHPIKLSFFPTISISFLLLATAYLPLYPTLAEGLWIFGATLQLLFTLYVINTWMHHEHFEVGHINPAWFIPAVGNVLVPITAVPLGYVDVAWFFFSVGMLFWVVLLTIIFYRVLFHNPIDQKLMPTLFILIAPPAVGFISYMGLAGDVDGFARFLYFSGLFLTLLLFSQTQHFATLQFTLSWWAYSFPLAAISIASMVMYEHSHSVFYGWVGGGLLLVLSLLVALLSLKTTIAVQRKKICLAEQ